jgi:hypothetical protein
MSPNPVWWWGPLLDCADVGCSGDVAKMDENIYYVFIIILFFKMEINSFNTIQY